MDISAIKWRDGDIIAKERLDDPAPQMSLYVVTYLSEGLRVKGYLAIPAKEKPCPGLVYCRGGIRRVGMVRISRIVSLVLRGYIVFAPFYRGNEGGEGREDFGGVDRYDLYHAITVIRSLPEVAPEPICLIGFSRGAIMALLAARDCENVGPVVVWGGVSDLFLTYEEREDLRRMLKRVVGHPKKQEEAYRSRSPIYWADRIKSPILIVHGAEDDKVGVKHAYKLAVALKEANKEHTLKVYEGLAHAFPKKADEKALDNIFQWMDNHR